MAHHFHYLGKNAAFNGLIGFNVSGLIAPRSTCQINGYYHWLQLIFNVIIGTTDKMFLMDFASFSRNRI